jgi:hypothetical protein
MGGQGNLEIAVFNSTNLGADFGKQSPLGKEIAKCIRFECHERCGGGFTSLQGDILRLMTCTIEVEEQMQWVSLKLQD